MTALCRSAQPPSVPEGRADVGGVELGAAFRRIPVITTCVARTGGENDDVRPL